jgi:hypothetical protein
LLGRGRAHKGVGGLAQDWKFEALDGSVIDAPKRKVEPLHGFRPYESLVCKWIEGDKERVTRHRRSGRVRRISESGRPEWKHLPESLPGCHQKIDEAVGFIPQVANPVRPWQGGWVEEEATRPVPKARGTAGVQIEPR